MYIYTIKGNKAVLLGQQSSYDQLIEQETYPARVDHPNTHAVLSYSEAEGIHWEYIPYTPEELRERAYETDKVISYEGKLYLCQRTGEAAGGTVVLQYLPHELVGHYFVEVT